MTLPPAGPAPSAGAAPRSEEPAPAADADAPGATSAGSAAAGQSAAGAATDGAGAAAGADRAGAARAGVPHPGRRVRRLLIASGSVLAAVVVAAGAFLAWGPVGLGSGPLVVASVAAQGVIPASGRSVLVIPVGAPATAAAVIDSVQLAGSGKYGPPGLFGVLGTAGQGCTGIWFPVSGSGGFLRRCAPGGVAPVTGRALPRRGGARGTDLALEVGPPGASGCWAVSRVTIAYHVGRRHYTVSGAQALFGCTSE